MLNFIKLVNRLVDEKDSKEIPDRLIEFGSGLLSLAFSNSDVGITHERKSEINSQDEKISDWPSL